jgi:thiol-disulfide isomerase/thioredoxin
MKNRYIAWMLALTTSSLYAQLPVDTSAQNKKVVLEEFTGIYCQFCPDGHKIAQTYKSMFPNDVVLINIHEGFFAEPNGSDPDFRTPFGFAIDSQANVSANPIATINRRMFPAFSGGMTISRNNWISAGNTVRNEPSYVNLALEASIDTFTQQMTVHVEGYFTDHGAPASMRLNIALLQNNVEGPQSGGATYYPAQVLPNGKYNHQHMLRHLLTGQWGDTLTQTAKGSLFSRTYTYHVPGNYRGVPVDIRNLEVVGFLTETTTNIITGATGPISYTYTPTNAIPVDLAVSNSMGANAVCDYTLTPTATLYNPATVGVDSVLVSYRLNNGTAVAQWVSGIPAQGTKQVSFPTVAVNAGFNKLSIEVASFYPNGFFDLNPGNNLLEVDDLFKLSTAVHSSSFTGDFESSGGASLPSWLLRSSPNATNTLVADSAAVMAPNQLGGFGQSRYSLLIPFYFMPNNERVTLYLNRFDFSASTAPALSFSYAHARYNSQLDRVIWSYSLDCGLSWKAIWNKNSATMSTAPGTINIFYPAPHEWKKETLALPELAGEQEVVFRMEAISANGNHFFLDDLLINGNPVSLAEIPASSLSLYPNPAREEVAIHLPQPNTPYLLHIFTAAGKKIQSTPLNSTEQTVFVPLQNLGPGVYLLLLEGGNNKYSNRLMITK